MDGALAENGGFDRHFGFLVVVFQREQQRQIRVAMKRPLIDRGIDGAKTGNKTVVGEVELFARLNDLLLTAAIELRAQAIPHRVPHVNQPPNPRAGFDGHIIQRMQDTVFVQAQPAILVDAIGIGFDVIRRGNGRVKSFFGGGLGLDFVNVLGQPGNRLCQCLAQIPVVRHQHRLAVPIHSTREPHFAQHHFGMGGEVFVDGKLFLPVVGKICRRFPSGAARRFTGAQFAEHHDVGGHFRAGIFLERRVGQTDCAKKLGFARKAFHARLNPVCPACDAT